MTKNSYLMVSKSLFRLGLSSTQILILAQVAEFNRTTGDCFISNKTMSDYFGVSESTIKREIKDLVNRGFITLNTKNTKDGRERHITLNQENIDKEIKAKAQNEPCVSSSVNCQGSI